MAQQADIVAYDGAATPVVHTFTGVGLTNDPKNGAIARWRETVATVPDGAQLLYTQGHLLLPSGVRRVFARVELPVMESVAGQNSSGYTAPPKVAYTDRYEMVGYFAPRSTETTRRIAEQLLLNILQNVTTSVTPVVAGQAAQLLQKLVQVT